MILAQKNAISSARINKWHAASGDPSHFAVHWEHPPDVPFIVHDLPFSGANAACGYLLYLLFI